MLENKIDLYYSQNKLTPNAAKIVEILKLAESVRGNYSLENLAKTAQKLTKQYFGNTIKLFTPLYISNYCTNGCVYCSFQRDNKILRKQMNEKEIHEQCEKIAETGLRQVLVLTGEAQKFTTFEYLKNSLNIVAKYFSAVSIEVYPLETQEYRILSEEIGVDNVAMYQETYNKELYEKYHLFGKKQDYLWRLNGISRACEAGMRAVQLGALLGLDEPVRELGALATHIDFLQKNYPETEVSVSFPRIRPIENRLSRNDTKFDYFEVNDKLYAKIIAAFRIVYPSLPITLSTRESEKIRNGLLNFGITKISAGVSTAVGENGSSGSQFEIADERSVSDICEYLTNNNFQPVFHDWNSELVSKK